MSLAFPLAPTPGRKALVVAGAASQYTDLTAPAGATSFYRITAVDTSANESAPATTSAFRPGVGANGNASDIAYDRTGVLHFAWYDTLAKTVRYAMRNTSGVWSAIQ